MSMYNLLFGVNRFASLWMAMLGIETADVGRFRDCYLYDVGNHNELEEANIDDLRIHVYTRNGGGNRECYQEELDKLAKHPCWVEDYDDSFDCTYCTVSFMIPDKFKPVVQYVLKEANWDAEDEKPEKKWVDLLDKLRSGKDDPQVQHAKEVGRRIFAKIEKAMEGGGVIEV